MRSLLRSLATIAVAVATATCADAPLLNPTGPVPAKKARLSLSPVFSKQAAQVFAQRGQFAAINFDHVHITLVRPPSEVVKDTTIAFTPDSPAITLDLSVDVLVTGETFTGTMDYISSGTVVFHGSGDVASHSADQTGTSAQEIVVQYVGAGANATRLVVSPKTPTIVAPSNVNFTVSAFDAQNAPVAGALISWTTSDPAVATINASTGVLAATGKRGTITVTASAPTAIGVISDIATATITLPAAGLTLVSGGGQTGKAGATLAQPAVVRVVAADAVGVPGVTVNFAPAAGGKVGATSVVTDASGLASTSLTLGGAVGTQGFAAVSGGFSVSILATATPGDPASIAVVSGGGQQDTLKRTLKSPFVVKVTDVFGNAVPGVAVSWARTSGTGSLSASTTTTDTDGTASVSYTLGTTVGSESVTASASGAGSVTFTVAAVAAGPANIAAVSGGGQTGRVLQPLAAPFVVQVTDATGNPVSGSIVTWVATNGTIAATTTTDAGGQTSTTMTLGAVVGSATASASVSSGKSVTFAATVQVGVVAKVVFKTSPVNPSVGSVIAPIQVELQDAGGNRTAAANPVSLSFGVNPTSATLGGTLTRTSVAGVATFDDITVNAAGAGFTLIATSGGITGSSAAFNVVAGGGGGLGVATKLAITTQPSPTTVSGVPFVQQPVIQVQDASGNPVPPSGAISVTATWSSGSVLNNVVPVGGTTGVASFTSLTVVGTGTGPVLFSAPGLTSVTSIPITSTPPPATAVQFVVGPTTTTAGSAISPPMQVKIVDGTGALVSTATNNVTLSIGTNPAGGTLSGTLTVAAVAGVATFPGLSINNAGVGYTLVAASAGLTGSTSAAFDITVPAPVTRTWTGAVSTVWTVAGNWDTGVPGSADDVIIPAGPVNQPTLAAPTSVRSVTIQSGATLTLTSSLSALTAGLINQGTLNLGSGTVVGTLNNQGLVLAQGSSVLTGALTTSATSILRIQGNPTYGGGAFVVSTGFTNTGTIELTDVSAAYGATLAVTAGTFVNAPTGVLSVLTGAGGPRALLAELNNQSTITIGDTPGLTIGRPGAVSTNSGTIAITAGSVTLNQTGTSPSFTNAPGGTITIASGHQFQVIGGTLDVSTGSMTGPGALNTINVTLTMTTATMTAPLSASTTTVTGGTITIPSGQTFNLVAGTLTANIVDQGLFLANGTSTVSGALTTTASSIVRIQGNPTYGGASLTTTTGFTNNGTLELTDVTAAYGASLTVTAGTLVNPVGGVISILTGASGARTIAAELNNQGTLSITDTQGLTLGRAGAVSTNSGTISITSGDLTVNQTGTSPSFTNAAGGTVTIAAGRHWNVTGGTLDVSTGIVNGPGPLATNGVTLTLTTATMTAPLQPTATTVTGGTVTIPSGQTLNLAGGTLTAAIVDQGLLLINGSSGLNGALTTTASSIIRVQGLSTYGGASFTASTGFTNNGTLELTDVTAAYGASLTVTAGTLVNPVGGVISILTGASGARTIAAELNNQGTLSITDTQGLTLGRAGAVSTNSGTISITTGDLTLNQTGTSPSFTNTSSGSITIAAGRHWNVTGGTLDVSTGIVNGPGPLATNGVTLTLTTATMTAPLQPTATTVTGGTVTIPSGQTLNLAGGTLTAAIVDQGLLLINGSSGLNGALTTTASSIIRVQGLSTYGGASFTASTGFTNNGTLELTDVTAAYGASLTVTAGTLVNPVGGVISILTGASGARTIAAELNNQGTLSITDTQGLTLGRAGAVSTNSGTISITTGDLTLNQTGTSPSFTNTSSGSITIAAGRHWNVTGGTLDVSTGIVNGPGPLATNGVTLTLTTATMTAPLQPTATTVTGGTVTIPSGQTLNLAGGTLTAAIVDQGLLLINGSSGLNGALTTTASSIIRVQGLSTYGGASFTASTGFTNNGTLELTDVTAAYGASLTVTAGTLVNPVGGVISILTGASGARTIAAELNNQGTLSITDTQGLTLGRAGAVSTNSGTISITTGDLTLNQTGTSPSFTNTSSGSITIAAGRHWNVTGGTLDVSTGIVNGPGPLATNGVTLTLTTATMTAPLQPTATTVTGGTVTIPSGQTLNLAGGTLTAAIVDQGSLLVNGNSGLNGTLTTTGSSTITVQGNSTYGGASFTVSTGFTNNGTITLTDLSAAYGAVLGVTSGTLVNPAGGTISILTGANGARTLAVELNNQGTLSISDTQGLTIGRAGAVSTNSGTIGITSGDLTLNQTGTTPSFTNASSGAITIASGRTWTVNGGTLDVSLGSVSGAGVLATSGATLTMTTATMTAPLRPTTTTVTGGTITIPSGQTLNLVGGTLAASVDNQGVFIANGTSTVSSTMTAAAGALTLVQGNSVYGGASFTAAGGLLNQGTIQLTDVAAAYGSVLTVSGGTLNNVAGGTITTAVGGGGARTIVGVVNNVGLIDIVPSGAGLLSITGSLSTSGTINIDLGGLIAGSNYDRLAVSGAVTLGGTLNVSLLPGFTPATGNVFGVMTYGSVSGDFATYTLPGGLAAWSKANPPTTSPLTLTKN